MTGRSYVLERIVSRRREVSPTLRYFPPFWRNLDRLVGDRETEFGHSQVSPGRVPRLKLYERFSPRIARRD